MLYASELVSFSCRLTFLNEMLLRTLEYQTANSPEISTMIFPLGITTIESQQAELSLANVNKFAEMLFATEPDFSLASFVPVKLAYAVMQNAPTVIWKEKYISNSGSKSKVLRNVFEHVILTAQGKNSFHFLNSQDKQVFFNFLSSPILQYPLKVSQWLSTPWRETGKWHRMNYKNFAKSSGRRGMHNL